MIKQIISNEKLMKRKSQDVDIENFSSLFKIKDLIETAQWNEENCAGLAANQIGYLDRIFLMKRNEHFLIFINPKMICGTGGLKSGNESCLSRPDKAPVKIRRYKEVVLEYYTLEAMNKISTEYFGPDDNTGVDTSSVSEFITDKYKPILMKEKFYGFEARVIQHELDHFEGKLI